MTSLALQITWRDLGPLLQYGPTVILLVVILTFLLKALPTWKEVKLKELELRGHDIETRGEEAKALSSLAIVLRDVAVEQRKATEAIDILQRVNSDAGNRLAGSVVALNERLERLEKLENLSNRVGALEVNVQPASTTT